MLHSIAHCLLAACLLLVIQSPRIRFDPERNLFLLENWTDAVRTAPEHYGELFTVSVDVPDVPPLLGHYRLEGEALAFAPQFPVQPGLRYRAVARIPGMAPISIVVDTPKPAPNPTTVVDRVYPTTHVLPENQLKFYIHFSAPMARGFAYESVALLDESGAKVDAPFLELGEELWDPEARRFTLFFDPGRIKRGLLSQRELGTVLDEGRRYTLMIDRGWLDANGNPLASDYQKTFSVGPPDRNVIDLDAWNILKPAAGTRNALIVSFPEPLDQAILARELDIVDRSGAVVKGSGSAGFDERSWIFTPDTAWKKGNYSVVAGAATADLAGNTVERPFEVDVLEPVEGRPGRNGRLVPFNID